MSFGDGDLHEKCEMYRRQLGGVNAANNRKSKRIRELEKRVAELESFVRVMPKCWDADCDRCQYSNGPCCDADKAWEALGLELDA